MLLQGVCLSVSVRPPHVCLSASLTSVCLSATTALRGAKRQTYSGAIFHFSRESQHGFFPYRSVITPQRLP